MVIKMAKQGMSRPETTHTKPRNDVSPVAEIQGKAKHGKVRANPIIAGTKAPSQKVYHAKPYSMQNKDSLDKQAEKPISDVYAAIDNDLARDNIENDIPAADLQDL